MAARAALGRALLASGTTIVGLGAATMLVSSVSMGIAKVVVTENKVRGAKCRLVVGVFTCGVKFVPVLLAPAAVCASDHSAVLTGVPLQKKTAVPCGVCHGNKKVRCDICSGECSRQHINLRCLFCV